MNEMLLLPNGVRFIAERVPYVRSCSLGVWINAGSRHEPEENWGSAHFIEHMMFKGTETRSADDLSEFMTQVGGQINAFTSKEITCYHGRVIDERLGDLAEVLCDMLCNSRFDEEDISKEYRVIVEEIGMYEDSPSDVADDTLTKVIFEGSLGRPVLGSRESLSKVTGSNLKQYKNATYTGANIVVALAGAFPDTAYDKITELFSALPQGEPNTLTCSDYTPGYVFTEKDTEQNHMLFAFPGVDCYDERRYAVQILSDILGGDMSSRLFREMREKRGLCYSVSGFPQPYSDIGSLMIYTALAHESQREAAGIIYDEIRRITDSGVTDAELTRSREQIEANLLMSLESMSSRMNRLGRNELTYKRQVTIEESIARYNEVTLSDILTAARELFDFEKASLSVVGDTAGADKIWEMFRA